MTQAADEIRASPFPGAGLAAEDLVRETHHRVSNHLQILAGLLAIEARAHPSPAAAEALRNARRRVLAVARLHGQLQSVGDDADVEISDYLKALCADMRSGMGLEGSRGLDLRLDAEFGLMSSENALAVGLAVNELITNAVKHAVSVVGVSILVRLARVPEGWRLTVADDGPGFGDRPKTNPPGLGLALVELTAAKLRGSMMVDKVPQGASISIYFP